MFDTSNGDYDGDLAQHYLQARSDAGVEKTLRYVVAAAHRALMATAYEEAARLYAEAIALVPAPDAKRRCALLLQCGEARKRVSDSDLAREAFAAAAAIARETGDAEQLAAAALGFARSWPTVSSVDAEAVELLTAALDAMPAENGVIRSRIMSRRALQLLYCGDPPEVERIAREAVSASRASGDAMTLARALQVLHAALWQPAHLRERLGVATEIIDLAGTIGDESIALWGMRPRIADLMELGDVDAAGSDVATYERTAMATRLPIYLWQAAVRRAMIAIFHGHLADGERLAQRALELGRQAEGQNLIAAFGGQLLVIKWQQGKVEDLRSLITASRQNQPQVKLWAAVLAFIEAEAGNTTEARAQFDELASDRFASLPDEDTRLVVIALATLVCAALGDGIRAEQLYELLLPYEGRNIVVSEGVVCIGASSQYLGMLAATARRWPDAARHFEDAIDLNTQTGGRPWLARTGYEYARLLLARRQAGDRSHARELLRTSLGIARDTGMLGLQEKIEDVLRSHQRLVSDMPGGLTSREREVLRLIARGLSTREISEALVLSERTSARHITNIYAKIGVRNRVEASAYARQHELDR
jgi:DNA-binding CsgD family transcriptional regulator